MMETRLVIAYALILALALAMGGAFFYVSREWRAHRRSYRQASRSRRLAREARARSEGSA